MPAESPAAPQSMPVSVNAPTQTPKEGTHEQAHRKIAREGGQTRIKPQPDASREVEREGGQAGTKPQPVAPLNFISAGFGPSVRGGASSSLSFGHGNWQADPSCCRPETGLADNAGIAGEISCAGCTHAHEVPATSSGILSRKNS